jgi:deoxyadenosine/deoxycytidine kinase
MVQLITVVGNSGVGKTTLTRALCEGGGFNPGLEQHLERPFQALFRNDHKTYALANQVDYLLLRAEQENHLRSGDRPGIQDGGLDMDFYIFTHLFMQKGYLTAEEYQLCGRLHAQMRLALPAPEIVLYLSAPLTIVSERFARRSRTLEITRPEDLPAIQALLDEWLGSMDPQRLLRVDGSQADAGYGNVLSEVIAKITSRLLNSA